MQLPDGAVLNAPHVLVSPPGGGAYSRHPKVVSVSPDLSSVVLSLTQGFAQGEPIVYISTDASDPLAAALEGVTFAPALAAAPAAALADLVAFTNGESGAGSPQRQGLASAIRDGLPPLNIAATTPSSPGYSPLWALNLAKWVGRPGPRQTSATAVQLLSAQGKVAAFDRAAPASNGPLGPSGIVVNCPIVATFTPRGAAAAGAAATATAATAAAAAAAGRKGASTDIEQTPTSSGCTPSALGYACVTEPQPGILLHFTLGSAQPPAGGCFEGGRPPQVTSRGDGGAAHFAVEANSPGYLAASFPKEEGRMWPADAVVGMMDQATGAPVVRSYHLVGYGIGPRDESQGWAQALGYREGPGADKVLCFSRALDSPRAPVVKSIDPDACELIISVCWE
jgi:hypothetical protein